jgi:hypothetical protein
MWDRRDAILNLPLKQESKPQVVDLCGVPPLRKGRARMGHPAVTASSVRLRRRPTHREVRDVWGARGCLRTRLHARSCQIINDWVSWSYVGRFLC